MGHGMRIISGTSRGRKLSTMRGRALRPTSDRVKESIFNILGGEIEGKVILDLFAGTGNLGIEALSRGARRAIFVEKGKDALKVVQRNLLQCGFLEQSEIIPGEVNQAIGFLQERGESFDLILMDPPYEKGWVQKTLDRLISNPIHHEGSIMVIEHSRRESLPEKIEGLHIIRHRKIGDTVVSFLQAI